MIGLLFTGFYGDHGRYITAPPANAYRLRTHLSDNGFPVRVVNYAPYWTPVEMVHLIERMPELRFVGFSTSFDKSLDHIRPAMRRIKAAFPQIEIIVGGPEIACRAQDVGVIDRIFLGYSEVALQRYCERLTGGDDLDWRRSQSGIPMIVADEQYPLLDTSDLRIDWHQTDGITALTTLPIEISRGCAFRCKFCAYPLMGKTRFDYVRSEESLIAEFRRNHALFGTTRYQFLDDTFNDSVQKIDLVQRAIRQSGVPVRFVTYLRHDLMAAFPQTIEKLSEMGLLGGMVGIESLDEGVRRSIGKGCTNAKTLETLARLKATRRDLWLSSGFIIGLPNETRDMVERTHRFLMDNAYDYLDHWHWQSLYINPHATRLTTAFGRAAAAHGYAFPRGGTDWVSPIMTYGEASDLARQFQGEIAPIVRPSCVWVNELLGAGLRMDDLVGRTRSDILAGFPMLEHVARVVASHKQQQREMS